MKRLLSFLLCLSIITGAARIQADDVPVAPISTKDHPVWGTVYDLSSRKINLMISPGSGGVVSMNYVGSREWIQTPIRFTASLSTQEKESHEHRAWKTSEGRQVVMISSIYGPPLSLRVVHIINLSADGQTFKQSTRVTGTGPGDHSLLAPVLTVNLNPPEKKAISQESVVMLHYGIYETAWSAEWAIELPEENLPSNMDLSEGEEALSLVSMPTEDLHLPPQGWTLVCTLKAVSAEISTD